MIGGTKAIKTLSAERKRSRLSLLLRQSFHCSPSPHILKVSAKRAEDTVARLSTTIRKLMKKLTRRRLIEYRRRTKNTILGG
jgi:hypothetical protein